MAEAFSKRPANVRDGRSVLQKTADVRDQLILYLYLLSMPMTTYLTYLLTLSLIFAIWHMKQTKPRQTRAIHRDPLEARGIEAQ